MRKKNIDWQDLIDSDDDKPSKPRPSASTSRTAAPAKQPTTAAPVANTPASRANAISTWQNFHVQEQARQEAETAHLPSDYPVPSESSASNSGSSAPAGSLHRQGSSYRPERFDALIRRAQNKAPVRGKARVRSRFAGTATTAKRVVRFTSANRTVVSMPRTAPTTRPRLAAPSHLFSVLATAAQIGTQQTQANSARERLQLPAYGSPQPSRNRVAAPNTPSTPSKISFGLATSADLAAYMQGKPKPTDTTSKPPSSRSVSESMHAPPKSNPPSSGISPTSRGLSDSIYAPKPNPPPVADTTCILERDSNGRQPESEHVRYATVVKDFQNKLRIVESDMARLTREKNQAEDRAAKAQAELAAANLVHQEYRRRMEDHAQRIQKEWGKKEEDWKIRERKWKERQRQWEQAFPSNRLPEAPSPVVPVPPSHTARTSASNPTPATNIVPSPAPAQPEEVWNPSYPAWFDRGPLLFLCRLKIDPKRSADVIQVHRNDDITELVQMFARARGLGPQAVTLIKQQIVGKRIEHDQKEAEKYGRGKD